MKHKKTLNDAIKIGLMKSIQEVLKKQLRFQNDMAKQLHITQSRVCQLMNGHCHLFSIDELFRYLQRLPLELHVLLNLKGSRSAPWLKIYKTFNDGIEDKRFLEENEHLRQ